MKEHKLHTILYFFVFLFTYLGFYTILLFLFNIGMGGASRSVTIPIRLIIMFLLLILFIRNIKKLQKDNSLPWFILFSLMYLTRLFVDYVQNKPYYMSISEVFVYFISFSFIPFICITSIRLDKKKINAIFNSIFIGGVLFSILVVTYYSRFIGQVGGRLASNTAGEEVMSPLTLSYSSTLIIGVFLFYLMENRTKALKKICLLLGVALSTVPFFLGASRGSLIALFIPFAMYFFAGKSISFRLRSLLLSGIAVLLIVVLDNYFHSGLLNRFLGTSEAIDEGGSSAVRLEIWKGSIQQFLSNPLFGDKLKIDKWTDGYVHNFFIEVLQTTGLFGFIPFLFLTFKAWKITFYILKYHKPYFWIAIIFIQSFFMNMFSGAIYLGSWFWISMALLFTLNIFLRKEQNSNLQYDVQEND